MLSKKNRLTKRGSFAYVYKHGSGGSSPLVKMFFVRSGSIKIGFSVSNKLGKATKRNSIKRKLRAATRELLPQIKCGCQIVFLAKQPIESAQFGEIKQAIFKLLDKSNLLKGD